ncbi:MAG: DUF86 domain-containing protein [Chloroflexi bacterium]|nr:DUF86 domain-containing protein [Chloroflexota bacterium]
MSRDYSLYLKDIVQAAEYILADAAGLSASDLQNDRVRVQAVLYNLLIIGEAIKAIPAEFRAMHPDVDWRGAAGMRDVLIHQYYVTDLDLVWDAISDKVKPLRDNVRAILESLK